MTLLPRHRDAVVPDAKLHYCLDPNHPTGSHKARVFKAALGLGLVDVPALRRLIRGGIASNEAELRYVLRDGTERWVVEWPVVGRLGIMRFITVWNVERQDPRPRLISCYLKEVK